MIAVIDYQAGNIASVKYALDRLDVDFVVTGNPAEVEQADRIIFPGVGHARAAMQELDAAGLTPVLKAWKKPLLGICLGMQLLLEASEEGDQDCLGMIKGRVIKFKDSGLKVPHMGWNTVKQIGAANYLFRGVRDNDYFYFVHSYQAPVSDFTIGETVYGNGFTAALNYQNFWGVQFHPEKSGASGLKVLTNFIEL